MKRLMTFFTVLALLSTLFTFTSCLKEDERDAFVLSGSWEGDFGMMYDDMFANYTDIQFIPEYTYANYGYGYQRDYFNRFHVDYEINWSIKNGRIYISYYDRFGLIPELETEISRYGLGRASFWGYVGNTFFKLYKIEDWYAKTRSSKSEINSTDDNNFVYDRTLVGNRFLKKR